MYELSNWGQLPCSCRNAAFKVEMLEGLLSMQANTFIAEITGLALVVFLEQKVI